MNGHLYAQVDKSFKKKVRSLSLDSGVPPKGSGQLTFFEHRANTLNRRNAYGVENKENAPVGLNERRVNHSNMDAANDQEIGHKVKSIDKLLQELGECSELLDSTVQQAAPTSKATNTSVGRSNVKPPGPPVRKAASFDAGERYLNRFATGSARSGETRLNNGVTSGMRTLPRGHNVGATSSRSPPVAQLHWPSDSSNNNWHEVQISNGFLSAGNTGEQTQFTPTCTLHEAPMSQMSPPQSPLSPKFYATQVLPRTFKASTISQTLDYRPSHFGPNRFFNDGGSLTERGLGYAEDGMVSSGRLVNGGSVAEDWRPANHAAAFDGTSNDFNNNRSGTNLDLYDFDSRKTIEDSHTLPEKGNVASKIALLSDMFQPDKAHPPPCQTLKGTVVPMPGLTSVSPADVFKEIASYNAKSLAPGELSHSSGTLYITGAPPTRIIEPRKHVPQEFDTEGLHEPHEASTRSYAVHKTGSLTFCNCHIWKLFGFASRSSFHNNNVSVTSHAGNTDVLLTRHVTLSFIGLTYSACASTSCEAIIEAQ